jgi:hypothetical protein
MYLIYRPAMYLVIVYTSKQFLKQQNNATHRKERPMLWVISGNAGYH